MAANSILIIASAFSGLAGALLTQVITAANTYFIDKRKQVTEVGNQYRGRKIEIGENFYFITGEKLAAIRKNIGYWKNWNNSRTESSLNFLNKEMRAFNAYMEKLNAENWKFNLIGLYFEVACKNDEISRANERSQKLFLRYLDLVNRLQNSIEPEREQLYESYAKTLFELCSHYDDVYAALELDMNAVKIQLLNDFGLSK